MLLPQVQSKLASSLVHFAGSVEAAPNAPSQRDLLVTAARCFVHVGDLESAELQLHAAQQIHTPAVAVSKCASHGMSSAARMVLWVWVGRHCVTQLHAAQQIHTPAVAIS